MSVLGISKNSPIVPSKKFSHLNVRFGFVLRVPFYAEEEKLYGLPSIKPLDEPVRPPSRNAGHYEVEKISFFFQKGVFTK